MAEISVIMGSQSDVETVEETIAILKQFKADYEVTVLSAHRTPGELAAYVETSGERGVKVFIAAAGGSAALAGVIAAHTTLPVIGIPMLTKHVGGLDSLLSTVQMPAGVPVATVAIGRAGARNAALLAIEILAITDADLRSKLAAYREEMAAKIRNIKLHL
ncbi:MAG: 5-(carboxyamino)imidazole ribonucleotide mutase [Candidatus Omnitrophica bacterium]|nr:5-(carboxyamino)imidazole ribonucleotide mutase [Candidatus Omnitrophota bacterium]